MLIDLTRKPLIVYPETCPTSVVVRSIGNHDVNGIVSFIVEPERVTRKRRDLPPDAKLTRGKSTLYETRLPLPGYNRATLNPYVREYDRHWPADHPLSKQNERRADILPDPFEVASVYKDFVTNVTGTWRAGVSIQHIAKMKKNPWVVGILDVTSSVTLSTIAVSGLEPNPLHPDTLPLSKAIEKTIAPGNAWTRILDDDS